MTKQKTHFVPVTPAQQKQFTTLVGNKKLEALLVRKEVTLKGFTDYYFVYEDPEAEDFALATFYVQLADEEQRLHESATARLTKKMIHQYAKPEPHLLASSQPTNLRGTQPLGEKASFASYLKLSGTSPSTPEYVVTCLHCVDELKLTYEIIREDDNIDLVILKLTDTPTSTYTNYIFKEMPIGDLITEGQYHVDTHFDGTTYNSKNCEAGQSGAVITAESADERQPFYGVHRGENLFISSDKTKEFISRNINGKFELW